MPPILPCFPTKNGCVPSVAKRTRGGTRGERELASDGGVPCGDSLASASEKGNVRSVKARLICHVIGTAGTKGDIRTVQSPAARRDIDAASDLLSRISRCN